MLSQIIIGLGAAIIYEAKAGLSIYDAFVFGLSDHFHTSYVYVRYVVDGIFLALGFIFKGSFGIGTIIAFFILGIIYSLLTNNINISNEMLTASSKAIELIYKYMML